MDQKNIEDDPQAPFLKGDSFLPERSYFSVRIAEMRLSEAGKYLSEFIPMCSCFLRYTYGRSQRTIPFVLGRETITSGLGKDLSKGGASNIQFNNVYVARNVPVKADNLLMYAALCRFKDSGFARGLLDLLSDAAAAVGGPAVGSIVKTGTDLTNRLGTLLGSDGVDTRFGMLNGNALDKSGYRVFAGVPAADLKTDELVMRDGNLVHIVAGQLDGAFDNIDYLVLALECRSTLIEESFGQVSILSFHTLWEDVRIKLLQGDKDGAEQVLKSLLVDVASSPDVTEADRLVLIASYRSAFDQWSGVGAKGRTTLMSFDASRTGKLPHSVTALLAAVRGSGLKAAKEEADKSPLGDAKETNAALGRRALAGANAIDIAAYSEREMKPLQNVSAALLSAALGGSGK